MSDKEAFILLLEQRIERLRQLREKVVAEVEAERQTAMHGEVEHLEQHLRDSELHLSQLKETAHDAWEEIRDSVEASWQKLSQAVKDLYHKMFP